jgi:hypothetical protein
MTSDNSREQVWDVYAKAIRVFDQKNADYGDAWRRNGWRGNLSRVFEKNERVRNLLWCSDPRTPAVGDETAVETLRDMLNTLAFAIINLEDGVEWGGETPRSQLLKASELAYNSGEATSFYDQVGSELPHDTNVIVHGHDEVVRTEVIPRDAMAEALSSSLQHGTDEMRPAEAEGTGRVPRKSRNKVVTDNPQA